MEPHKDLTPADAQAWLASAGPLYRCPVGINLTLTGHVVYDAYSEVAQTAGEVSSLVIQRRVGYMTLHVPPRRNFLRLRQLWVDLDVRRHGVGRRLIDEAITVELDNRRPRMLGSMHATNLDARRFLTALGFRITPAQNIAWRLFSYVRPNAV